MLRCAASLLFSGGHSPSQTQGRRWRSTDHNKEAQFRCFFGSLNPVKSGAMKEALIETLTQRWSGQFQSLSVLSGVSPQPIGNMETLQGACNRIQAIRDLLETDEGFMAEEREGAFRTLIAAIEGGVGPAPEPRSKSSGFSNHGYGECFAYVRVESFDGSIIGQSRSCTFQMPHELSRLVYESGMELGHADDLVFGRQNSGSQTGTVGILTSDLVTRQAYYMQPAILALIPFASRAASY